MTSRCAQLRIGADDFLNFPENVIIEDQILNVLVDLPKPSPGALPPFLDRHVPTFLTISRT